MTKRPMKEINRMKLFSGGYEARLAGYPPESWRENFKAIHRYSYLDHELWEEAHWLAGYEKASQHIQQGLIAANPAVLVA